MRPGPVSVAPPEDASVGTGQSTPYGLALSCNGNIYGSTLSSRVFEIDPGLVSGGTAAGPALMQDISLAGRNYGIACDNNGIVWVAKYSGFPQGAIRWDPGAGTWANTGSPPAGGGRGITVDFAGNVWMVSSTANQVFQFNAAGAFLNAYPTGTTGSVGVGVTQDQNIIVVGRASWDWRKLNVNTGAPIPTGGPELAGPQPYSYSDISGNLQNIVGKKQGTWTVITDAGDDDAFWHHVSWTDNIPPNTGLTIKVRSAGTPGQLEFENWETLSGPGDLPQLRPGRYLETRACLTESIQCNSPGVSPVLFDLTVKACRACNIFCHPDTTVQCTSYEGAIVNYSAPTWASVCDTLFQVTCDPPSGSQFPLGQTTVTCTGVDIDNNVYECQFVVTVEGNCDIDISGACCLDGSCFSSTPGYCLQRGGTWFSGPCLDAECEDACLPPPAGLMSWWPMDGPATGVTQNLADPFAPGNLSGVTQVAGEYVNNAYAFAGNDYIQVNSRPSVDIAFQDFTFDVWLQTGFTSEMTLLDKRFNGPLTGYRLYLTSGYPGIELASIGTTVTAELSAVNGGSGAFVADNLWHLVGVTVDRDGVGQFYVDGIPRGASFSVTTVQTTLSNSVDLWIGRNTPASASADYFNGRLDELEIFNRALSAQEMMDLWVVGDVGKCREACYAASFVTCCDAVNAFVDLSLCNYDDAAHLYSYSISPVNSGPGCSGGGATASSNGWGTLNVGPGECLSIPVEMFCPTDILQGQHACYQVQVFNHDTGRYFYCGGSVRAPGWWCPDFWDNTGPIGPMLPLDPFSINSNPTNLNISVAHIDLVPGTVTFDYELLPVTMTGDSSRVLSLGGLPPGVPLTGQVEVPGDGSAIQIPFTAQYMAPQQVGYDKIVLLADVMDSSGIRQPIAETSVRSAPISLTAVPDPEGPPAGEPHAMRPFRALPNPFSSSGRIEFEVPDRRQPVTLKVFDLTGRLVKELAYKEPMGPGLQSLTWDGTDGYGSRLPSGIFFLRLTMEAYEETVKIALVR